MFFCPAWYALGNRGEAGRVDEERTEARKRLGERMADYRLPRWEELPDLELYMDQVLSLVERYLGDYPGFEERRLTASMVNNYVKMGVMPPPVKKRYSRVHLAYLLMICLLKAALPETPIRVDAACCAGVTPESHRNALKAMQMCHIEIEGEEK